MTFTGLIGRICMYPLRLIINLCVALKIHPNTLTFVGVLMVIANIFDFIDGKVAHESNAVSAFGGFWDSVVDRFSDIALFLGLIYLLFPKAKVIITQRDPVDSCLSGFTKLF